MTIHRNSRNLHLKDRIGWYIPHRSFCTFSFGHCVVCSSLIYEFWLPLWYLQTLLLTIVLSVLLWFTDSDYPFGVFKLFFWPLCCLFFFDLRILITPLVSSNCSWYMSTTHSVPITATVSNSNPFEDTKGIVWSRES